MPASAGYTLFTATRIQNLSGRLLPNGRVNLFPTIPAIAGGGGGLIVATAASFLVVNGVIVSDIYGNTAQVADSSLTSPANLSYRITIIDTDSQSEIQGPGYGPIQPSGPTWSLDTYVAYTQTQSPSAQTSAQTAVTDVVTGLRFNVTLINGTLVYIPASLGTGTPFALIVTDAGLGKNFAICIRNGVLGTQNIGTLGTPSAVATLIDTVTGTHYTISENAGTVQETAVASTVPGAAQILLADWANGARYALTISNGSLQTTAL